MREIPRVDDPVYLRRAQYKDATNLNARIELHRRFSTNPYGWSRWAFDQLAALPNLSADRSRRLLELGAGAGTFWAANAQRIPRHWRIVISDFSAGMLDAARRAIAAAPTVFHLLVADAHALPFGDEDFDAVVANHMLYHLGDRPRALHDIRRVLRPEGFLLASTIGKDHLREIDQWLQPFGDGSEYWGVASTQGFSLDNGGEQLAAVFDRIEMRRYDDSLHVTEVEPVMAYITSMRAGSRLADADAARLREQLQAQIAAQGALEITKASGLFLASGTRLRPTR